jgi:hypothetical protein
MLIISFSSYFATLPLPMSMVPSPLLFRTLAQVENIPNLNQISSLQI